MIYVCIYIYCMIYILQRYGVSNSMAKYSSAVKGGQGDREFIRSQIRWGTRLVTICDLCQLICHMEANGKGRPAEMV